MKGNEKHSKAEGTGVKGNWEGHKKNGAMPRTKELLNKMLRFTSRLVEHCPAGQGYMVTVKTKLPIGTGSCKSPI